MKLLQEIRGFAEMSQRRPHPKPPVLFLAQLRSQLKQSVVRRRRLRIPIQMHELPDIPNFVKINHIKRQAAPTPLVAVQ